MKNIKPQIGDLVMCRTAGASINCEPFLRVMLILSKTKNNRSFVCLDNFWEHVPRIDNDNSRVYTIGLGAHYDGFTVIRKGKIICKESMKIDVEDENEV